MEEKATEHLGPSWPCVICQGEAVVFDHEGYLFCGRHALRYVTSGERPSMGAAGFSPRRY
jgi:hypothetical protein